MDNNKYMTEYIKICWMDEDSFKRYAYELDGKFGFYENQYLTWMEKQMNLLENEDVKFIYDLVKRINYKPIKIMDLESCSMFKAGFIFFGPYDNLVIGNFR